VVDHKDLIKVLTRRAVATLESAVILAVNSKHYEITIVHLFASMLDQEACDVARMFDAAGIDRRIARSRVDEELVELRTGNAARPTFSQLMMLLFQDASWQLTPDQPIRRIRTGALIELLHETPTRYDAARFLTRVGVTGECAALSRVPADIRAAWIEEHECRAHAPKVAPRLPRHSVIHRVTAAERLIEVARYYAVDLEDLARDNDLEVHAELAPGASILVRPLVDLPPTVPGPGPGDPKSVDYH